MKLKFRTPGIFLITALLLAIGISVNAAEVHLDKGNTYNSEVTTLLPDVVSNLQTTVTGKVVSSEDGQPLPGVSVVLKGSTTGTSTDFDGNYSLNISSNDGTLVFSYIGFETQEIKINGRSTIDVSLVVNTESLDEVVLIGYGTQKKKDLTGSYASLSSETIASLPAVSFEQSIQGRVAGVQVTSSSNAPGGGISMRIRGGNSISASNEPLYVVDGIQINGNNEQISPGTSAARDFNSNDPAGNALSTINPSDIQSIEILKDASATAIYGSRGANGVVIITTKSGKKGKSSMTYDHFSTMQTAATRLDLLDRDGYTEHYNNILIARDSGEEIPAEALAIAANTDWQDEIFNVALMQNHQLGFNGGNEKVSYNAALNYFDQDGVVISTGFKRYTARLNLDATINDRLKFGSNMAFTHSIRKAGIVNGNGFRNDDIVYSALVTPPWVPVRDNDGFLYNSPRDWEDRNDLDLPRSLGQNDNPLLVARDAKNDIITNRFLGNMFLELELSPGLKARSSMGADMTNAERSFYLPSTLRSSNNEGLAVLSSVRDITWINTNTLTFDKQLNDTDNLTLLGGFEIQQNTNKRQVAEASNFFTDIFEDNNLGAAAEFEAPSSQFNKWTLMSFFARANFVFKDKYLFTATGRTDGSSRFGTDNRWGFFPSGAIAWRVSNEEFLVDSKLISNLKFRGSYGLTGNTDIGSYQSLSTYDPSSSYIFGGSLTPGTQPNNIANPDLKWERTKQLNVGLDLGLFSDRISITADYYTKTTDDLLLNRAIPGSSGFTTSLQNVGSVKNEGVELAVGATIISASNFSWSIDANVSVNRNEVLDLGDDTELLFTTRTGRVNDAQTIILREGEPIGSFYGYEFDGIWESQEQIDASPIDYGNPDVGEVRLRDTNGDNIFNSDDKTIIGNSVPDYIYGLNNSFTFGNMDLSFLLQGSQGNEILNFTRGDLLYMGLGGRENKFTDVLTSFVPGESSDGSTEVPQVGSGQNGPLDSRFIEDGSYLRLRNLLIGYNFNTENLKGLSGLRLYISGQNLFTITDYSGFDPEVNVGGQSNLIRGVDFVGLPTIRSYTLGLSVQF